MTDAAGGALPGAVVTVAGPEGRQESVTGLSGEFAFAALPAGDYVVAAALPGFGPSETAVAVAAGATVTVPLVLEIGRRLETVSVIAETPTTFACVDASAIARPFYVSSFYTRWS